MALMKPLSFKRSKKSDREQRVLIGLVELYIKIGKPIGSHTLQEHGFGDLSSATIRNYFAQLEEAGYLMQPHSSGGRIPTDLSFRTYANECLFNEVSLDPADDLAFQPLRQNETRELANYLTQAAEILSAQAELPVFLSAPRFDHDFIRDMKLVSIDPERCLCVVVTHFGLIRTEILRTDKKWSVHSLKRMENYFLWRLQNPDTPAPSLEAEEEQLAQSFYHEIMVRYLVGYSNFTEAEVYRTGFSRLLAYPELSDPVALATSLSLFENRTTILPLLNDTMRQNALSCWIGSELAPFSPNATHCSILTIPYHIHTTAVGSIGILGPTRLPYRKLFALLELFSQVVSESLTNSLYKFKLSYRQPHTGTPFIEKEERTILDNAVPILLEDKSTLLTRESHDRT